MADVIPTAGFITQLREQIRYLKKKSYVYHTLNVYLVGIQEPWTFSDEAEFEFSENGELLIVREGPCEKEQNEGVPEYVIPLQHIIATELDAE